MYYTVNMQSKKMSFNQKSVRGLGINNEPLRAWVYTVQDVWIQMYLNTKEFKMFVNVNTALVLYSFFKILPFKFMHQSSTRLILHIYFDFFVILS